MDEAWSTYVDGIITLQVGHYSNFIGTHWWNIQQSAMKDPVVTTAESSQIQHGLLLREDVSNGKQIRCTPRLLIVDLKGSLKSLREDGCVNVLESNLELDKNNDINVPKQQSEAMDAVLDSPEKLSVHHTEPLTQCDIRQQAKSGPTTDIEYYAENPTLAQQTKSPISNFFNLDNLVEVWSDFLGNNYHQNTVLLLDDYWHNEEGNSFSSFGQGYSTNENERFWDSWEDRMHFFVEECDKLQGFQVLTDLDDGFGGLTTRMLYQLQDCYGPKSVAVYGSWPCLPSQYIDENIQIINSALAVGHIVQDCSLFAPVSLQEKYYGKEQLQRKFPYLSYKANSHYHTSAIIASMLDTASLQYRLGQSSLSDFCNSLTGTGHKIVASSLALPLPTHSKSLVKLFTESCLYDDVHCLTPSHENKLYRVYSAQGVLRGVPSNYPVIDSRNKQLQRLIANESLFEAYIFSGYKPYFSGTTFYKEPLKTLPPYPSYFNEMVGANGLLQAGEGKEVQVQDTPMLTSLFTSNGMFDLLFDILTFAKKVKRSKRTIFEQTGIEQDELKENMERLAELAHLYDEKRASELL